MRRDHMYIFNGSCGYNPFQFVVLARTEHDARMRFRATIESVTTTNSKGATHNPWKMFVDQATSSFLHRAETGRKPRTSGRLFRAPKWQSRIRHLSCFPVALTVKDRQRSSEIVKRSPRRRQIPPNVHIYTQKHHNILCKQRFIYDIFGYICVHWVYLACDQKRVEHWILCR